MVLFIVSFGASSGAQPGVSAAKPSLRMQQGIAQDGKPALRSAFDSFKKWLTSFAKEKIIVFIKKKALDMLVVKTETYLLEKACGAAGEYIFGEFQSKVEPIVTFSEKLLSLTDKIPIYGVCSKIDTTNGSPNDEIACAKNVLESVGMVDPTGICAIAADFMQPVCDIN